MCTVNTGIDTFSYFCTLTAKQKEQLLSHIKHLPKFYIRQSDYFMEAYEYASDAFAEHGIKLRVSKSPQSPWLLYIIVHPTLLLGDKDRSALYQFDKKTYQKLTNRANQFLDQLQVPIPSENLKLTRVDVTANLVFDDASSVQRYLRILKKGLLLSHYRLMWFHPDDGKAKDAREANRCSYRQGCKSATFFAYDKTAQLHMIDRFPDRLIGKQVLRLEVQLRRKAMVKWVGADSMDKNEKILKKLCKQTTDIIQWYLERMKLSDGVCVRYEAAVEQISGVKGQKLKKRMLYLLRKTSDSRDLTSALDKLMDKYSLKKGQVNRVLKEFQELGISPITLPNTEQLDELPPLSDLLRG